MKAYRCSWTGLYYPPDYVKEWGRKYGIGMGPVPVSEAMNSRTDLPCCIPESGDMNTAMHPVEFTRAQIDLVDIPDAEYEDKKAILSSEDPRYDRRAAILRGKQLEKPNTKLAALVNEKKEHHQHG